MSILSGIKKVIPYFKNADGNYEQLSYKTSSQTVDFDDGKTAETKLGAINGITKSLNSTSDSIAISASAGKSLQDQITALNSNIAAKLTTYTMTSTDDARQTGYSIGWMVGTNEGYITLNVTWICLQFKIASASCAYRIKFGNNAFSSWKGL